MRKIIDVSHIRDEILEMYFSNNINNRIVLTDFAAAESYKGCDAYNIKKNMEILCKYPKQVIILKSTLHIAKLKAMKKGSIKRMIDKKQTKGFDQYCKAIINYFPGICNKGSILNSLQDDANKFMDILLEDAEKYRESIGVIEKKFDMTEISMLKNRQPISDSILDRISERILYLSAYSFRDNARTKKLPEFSVLPYTFIFRHSMCIVLLTIKWISEGGYENVKVEKLRNDLADMTYAAYATFFDGLIAEDAKTNEIYGQAKHLIRYFID